MYQLQVYHPRKAQPIETLTFAAASEVIDAIPTLLREHDGCERIIVSADGVRLFSVDCHGNSTPA